MQKKHLCKEYSSQTACIEILVTFSGLCFLYDFYNMLKEKMSLIQHNIFNELFDFICYQNTESTRGCVKEAYGI